MFDGEAGKVAVDRHVIVLLSEVVLTEKLEKLTLGAQSVEEDGIIGGHLQHPLAEESRVRL